LAHTYNLCLAGHRAKKAKTIFTSLATSLNNQELKCLTNAGAMPEWFPGIQEVWKHTMNHISHLNLTAQESPHLFVLPPFHLFWGGEPQNQCIYYYHYLLLFNEIKNWPKCDLPALTTQEWRSILGNTYWKKQWPKHGKNNPSMFDQEVFWKYGGSLLFGGLQSADIAVGCYNPTSQLACHCHVQLSMADDTNIHEVVFYYLNLFHVYKEIKEMVHLQFPTDFEKQWRHQTLKPNQIVEMWTHQEGAALTLTSFVTRREVGFGLYSMLLQIGMVLITGIGGIFQT
jgi:hypothetical protein